ncbi:MAG: type 2 isopentenyl-diphosphate Delta-isomerase, partial [Bacilli bacterium]
MSRSSRKLDHVNEALRYNQPNGSGWEDIRFVHNSLPSTNVDRISIETCIGELSLRSPIIINAMTGGAAETLSINERLAFVAKETGVAMAVGSQMSAIRNPDLRDTYSVIRKIHNDGLVFANLGGEATIDQATAAVEMIGADALQIHLNVMQELIMPEGDREFEGILENIARIKATLSVPIIVKEVGFGISQGSCEKLIQAGVTIVDVGGAGGTNFAFI